MSKMIVKNEKGSKLKKITGIVLDVLLYLFLILAILSVLLTVASKKSDDDGTVTIFGIQLRRVLTGSMEECAETDVSKWDIGSISKNSVVFVDTVPKDPDEALKFYQSIKEGDVLTFRYLTDRQITITHRVKSSVPNDAGGFTIKLEGDNKYADVELGEQEIRTEETDSPDYVIGKVTGQSYFLGLIITLLSSPLGVIFIIILPCLIVILLEVIRIVSVLNEEKKKRFQEEQAKKDSEIEALRQRLAALENTTPKPEHEGESDV